MKSYLIKNVTCENFYAVSEGASEQNALENFLLGEAEIIEADPYKNGWQFLTADAVCFRVFEIKKSGWFKIPADAVVDPLNVNLPIELRLDAMENETVILSNYNDGEIYVGMIVPADEPDGNVFYIATGPAETNTFCFRSVKNISACIGGYVITYCPPVDELL